MISGIKHGELYFIINFSKRSRELLTPFYYLFRKCDVLTSHHFSPVCLSVYHQTEKGPTFRYLHTVLQLCVVKEPYNLLRFCKTRLTKKMPTGLNSFKMYCFAPLYTVSEDKYREIQNHGFGQFSLGSVSIYSQPGI